MPNNILIKSDNLAALQYLLNNGFAGKIDLVYIDPPYATGGNFTITNGRATTISNSRNGNIAYTDTLKGTDYIEFLRERLLLLKELLSDKGSIYRLILFLRCYEKYPAVPNFDTFLSYY
jgi:adenine-specific DNA-methyltransferase